MRGDQRNVGRLHRSECGTPACDEPEFSMLVMSDKNETRRAAGQGPCLGHDVVVDEENVLSGGEKDQQVAIGAYRSRRQRPYEWTGNTERTPEATCFSRPDVLHRSSRVGSRAFKTGSRGDPIRSASGAVDNDETQRGLPRQGRGSERREGTSQTLWAIGGGDGDDRDRRHGSSNGPSVPRTSIAQSASAVRRSDHARAP